MTEPIPLDPLPSWNDESTGVGTGAKERIIAFVDAVTTEGSTFVAPEERIAVFDNDGTLWSEKPVYVQQAFVEYRKQQGEPVREESLDDYAAAVLDWLAVAENPIKHCLHTALIYQPMLELLRYLRTRDFKTYIISGGGIEFVRPWSEAHYGIPPEQVVGSNVRMGYRDDPPTIVRLPERHPRTPEEGDEGKYHEKRFVDDKWGKPVGINAHIGRRPIAAFGNSDGDKQMLEWTTAGDGLRFGLLVHHTDGTNEFAYDEPSDQGQLTQGTIDEAHARGWTVVDMARDWAHVSPPLPAPSRTS